MSERVRIDTLQLDDPEVDAMRRDSNKMHEKSYYDRLTNHPADNVGLAQQCFKMAIAAAHGMGKSFEETSPSDILEFFDSVAWDRTPGLPPALVTQERYDAICKERKRLSDKYERVRYHVAPLTEEGIWVVQSNEGEEGRIVAECRREADAMTICALLDSASEREG